MGYSGIYRVATCCIIVQVGLLSVASALPTVTDGGKQNPAKAITVKDIVVKEVEDDPSKVEDKRTSYYGKTTESEDTKTKTGRRVVDGRHVTDNETHLKKRTEYDDNEHGKQTKIARESSSFTDHEDIKRTVETAGTGTLRRSVFVKGSNDSVTNRDSVNQDMENGSVYTEKKKSKKDDYQDKSVIESYIDKQDKDHVETRRKSYDGYKNNTEDVKADRTSYVIEGPDDTMAITSENRTTTSENNLSNKHKYQHAKVVPGRKEAEAKTETWSRHTNKDVEERESDVHHETPAHDIYVNEQLTTEHTRDNRKSDVDFAKRRTVDEKGTLLTRLKKKREAESEILKHTDKITLQVEPKARNAQNLSVTLQTETIDKDNRKINETRERDLERKSADGSTRKENIVEVSTETYDMHKLKPEITKKREVKTSTTPPPVVKTTPPVVKTTPPVVKTPQTTPKKQQAPEPKTPQPGDGKNAKTPPTKTDSKPQSGNAPAKGAGAVKPTTTAAPATKKVDVATVKTQPQKTTESKQQPANPSAKSVVPVKKPPPTAPTTDKKNEGEKPKANLQILRK